MVDPVSLVGLAVQIGDIIWKVYEYGKEVKEWKSERRALWEELFALKGVLEHTQQRCEYFQGTDDPMDGTTTFMQSTEFREMILSTKEFLDDLFSRLTVPEDKLRRAVKALKWPLNKSDILTSIERLERVKAWFVMTMMSDSLDLSRDTYHEVHELKSLLHREYESRIDERQKKVKGDLVHWLAPVSPSLSHTKAFSKWQEGTGSWFVKGYFEEWFESDEPNVLWLRDPVNILGSLIVQLAEKVPPVLDAYQAKSLSPKGLKVQELEDQILDHCKVLERFYILIDALNESSSSSSIVTSFSRIVQGAGNVGIFMTSTPDAETQDILQGQLIPVDMRPQWIEEDVRFFVNVKIQQTPSLRDLSEKIKSDIRQTVVEKADGMFRWVQCQMDFLAAQRTGKAVRRALEQLPNDLNSVYVRMLASIAPADQIIAKQAFMWLSFSKRPLSLLELCEAVVIDEDDHSIDEDSRLRPPTVLLRLCKGLVVDDENNGQVALAHSSIKTFLTSATIKETEASFFAFDYQEATQTIIKKCLIYLMFDDFGGGCCDRELLQNRLASFHLLNYATLQWAVHANQSRKPMYSLKESDHLLISRFLSTYDSSTGSNFTHWVLCLIPEAEDKIIRATQPLYYMSSFGLTSIVERMLKSNRRLNVDAYGGRQKSTALQVSCVRDSTDVVRLLLEHGADPNTCNIQGLSCLFWAVRYAKFDVYVLLRQYGAEPNGILEPHLGKRDPLKALFRRTLEAMESEYQRGTKAGI
ncbi:MAG: hypothetical protein Q9165_000382 [Trypethelium subeluteriae]